MLPFFGRVHVAYIPGEKIIGLSKIPRIVEMFGRRLQDQKRMTRQIADLLVDVLQPQGVAVVIEGSHMCSMMRGVKKEHPRMVTKTMWGLFKDDNESGQVTTKAFGSTPGQHWPEVFRQAALTPD